MTSGVDPFEQAMRDALVAEHQRHVAQVQRSADEAAARGREWYRKWHQDHADALRAMRYPWEEQAAG